MTLQVPTRVRRNAEVQVGLVVDRLEEVPGERLQDA